MTTATIKNIYHSDRQDILIAADGRQIPVWIWLAKGIANTANNTDLQQTKPETISQAKGVIHINHGMAEYAGRYASTAKLLNQSGYIVVAHDHRGHGPLTTHLGSFSPDKDQHQGWQKVLDDSACVIRHCQQIFPALPLFILGHSMGSQIVRALLCQQRFNLHGVILSGTTLLPPSLLMFAKSVASIECWRKGANSNSRLISALTFDAFNKKFRPNRTQYDWLTRDQQQVDLYVDDKLCGFECYNSLWRDFFNGLQRCSTRQDLSNIDTSYPIFIFGGDQDPSTDQGKGSTKLAATLKQTGIEQVEIKLWPEGRHEMFNETNKKEVITHLVHWLNQWQGKTLRKDT